MANKIEIISAAMLLLGHGPVDSIGNDAPAPIQAASFLYDLYYPSFLTRYQWGFCIKQGTLSQETVFDEVPEFSYAYLLPNDYLSLIRVDPWSDYMIYQTLLYYNIASNLKLFYTYTVDEGVLPPYFIEFMIEKLAEVFAMKITQQVSLVQLWGISSEKKLQRAIQLDSQGQSSLLVQSNPIAASKYGSIMTG